MLDERFGEPMFNDGMERDVLSRFGDTRTELEKGTAARLEVLWVKSGAMVLLNRF